MKKILCSLAILFFLAPTALALDVPDYRGWVNDFANVIDDSVETTLNQRISDYEKQTTNEIAVVTIVSLEGDNLEDFSIRLADKWKVGKEDKDNGVILLFAVKEKRVRLEVGYGLEGVLNDAKAGRLLDDYVVKDKNAGNFTAASQNGTEAIIKVITDESASGGSDEDKKMLAPIVIVIVIILILIFFGIVSFLVAAGSGTGGGVSGSSGGGISGSSSGGFSGDSGGGFGGGGFGGGGASR